MKIIDSHINITADGEWINPRYDASLARLLRELAAANIAKGVLISLPGTNSNAFIADTVKQHPAKFKAFGCLDFTREDLIAQAARLIENGFSGIKIHPRLQGINICQAKYNSLWEYCNANKIILLVDGYYQLVNNQVKITDLLPLAYERHIKAYPDLTFILAHAGFHRVLDTLFLCRSYENFYCDISYSLNLIMNTSLEGDYKMLLNMGDRKVLFGSDFPEIEIASAKTKFLSLAADLSSAQLDNILFNNANKIFWPNDPAI